MSIQSPVGTLDIKNATLRVGKLEVSNIQGVDTALNVTRSNAILIYDDQASTTTFTGFTSTPGVRDTGNGYLDLAGEYVYWGQKLPNSWVMEFEMDIRSGTSAGPLYSNIFSTTATGGDGYSFTFNDNNDKITLKYDGTTLTEATVSGLFTATENWQKVAINYERGRIAISVGASRKFFYQDIERSTPYVNGEYINFSSASTDGRKIRNLKITNGAKWTYAGESNVVFQQGSVGVGVTDPQYTLDVGGDINLSGSFYQGGAPFVSSLWTDGSESLYYRSNVEVGTGNLFVDTTTSNVGIGTTTPAYTLDVEGDINFTGNFYQGGSEFVSSLWTDGPESLYYRSNIEAGTANLFVDTTTGRVGIGTTTPSYALDVVGTVNAQIYEGDGGLLSNIASNLETITTNGNVTSNTVQFTNSNVGIVATGNVEANYFIGKGTELEGVALSTDLDDNSSRITTISTDLSDNASRIDTISTDLSDNSSRIATIATDLSDNSSRIATVSSDLSDNASRIDTISTDLSDNSSRIATVSSDLSDNASRIDTISSDLSDNSSRITNIESGEITLTGDKTFSDNVTVNGNLFVGSNLYVDDLGSNVLVVDGNASMETLTLGDIGIVPSYGLNHVTAEFNETGDTIVLTNASKGLDVTSNIELGGNLKFDANVLIPNMRVADFATNVVTYDAVTGEMLDSGGLISNKFSVVSEQPPEALTGASTAVDNHGTYTVSTSASDAHNAFNKSSTHWTSGTSYTGTDNAYDTGVGSRLSSATEYGEWIRIDFPYKATVRHVSITPSSSVASFPGSANVYGSNDGTTWTELANWSDVTPSSVTDVRKFAVNATSGYSKYGLVATKAAGTSTSVNVGEWRIFAESFAIDGGIMNTTAQISLDNGIQSNLEVGTANLFVDVTTSNVGIGTNTPLARLDVHGTANVGALTASSGTVVGDLTVQGDFTVTGTTVTLDQQNLTIRDPIIEIGKDNLVSPVNDLGLIMTRPSGGNVAIIYDETTSNLEIGYTLGNAEETEITMDTGNPLDVNINGNLSVTNTFTIQSFTLGQTFDLDSVTAVGGDSAQAINITNTDASTSKFTGALKVAGGVGVVGNVYAGKNVDVGGNVAVGKDLTVTGNTVVGEDLTVSEDLTVTGNVVVSSNLEVGTANLFVDTVSGNVGIGITDPGHNLDIVSEMNLRSVSNTASIKYNSNVVTEYVRSKKLIKYPREVLTSASQNGYVVTASRDLPGTYDKWRAFNNLKGGSSSDVGWHTSTGSIAQYTGTNNIYSGTKQLSTETDSGEWIAIELPISIKLIETHIWSQYNYAHLPKGGVFYAKNNASDTWTELYRYTGNVIASRNAPNIYQIDTNEYFKYFAFVVTHRYASGEGISIGEWELYGIPEYDPEAHGTDVIARSVPNVPNTDWLEVYYDAKDLSDGSISTVNDLKPSGTALNGTVVGDVAVSDGVFTFDGSGDYIYNSQSSHTDSGAYTASVWVKWDENASGSTGPCIFQYGNGSNYKSFGMTSDTSTRLRAYIYSATAVDIQLRENGKWVHLLATYKAESSTIHFYVDGALIKSGTNANNMSLDASPYLALGVQPNSSDSPISTTYFKGSIANFRLFNRVLSAEEAWQLYAYQKDYFQLSPDVMTLKNGALGVGTLEPRAMLDVRGAAYFSSPINIDGTVVSSFTGKHLCFPDGPMDKGLIVSANKNKYVTLNGSVVTGLEAIKSDESLPIVSLSNTASDVSVFGVVHDIETGGTTRTNETGGKTRKPLGDNRVIVNSLGEGAMWVTNTNGNLISGDYITTSNVTGYGQKQDDDILHSYTVAKITMDCDFNPEELPVQVIKKELDSYGRLQWEDDPSGATEKAYKIRYIDASGIQTDEANAVHIAAFVGCTYHCG